MFNLNNIVRENIKNLKPYSSARDEFEGDGEVFLDANENPFENGINRYPDPLVRKVKGLIANMKNVSQEQIFLGNGSDEAIDLLFRIFCEPGRSNVIIPDPTYGMYSVCAEINDVLIKWSSLTSDFQLDIDDILKKIDIDTKLIFICSPNNPTGNVFKKEDIIKILENFNGIIVIDEAYVDFSNTESWLSNISNYQNLVILQTFSKAWGMAGVRLGMAFASKEIIQLFNKVKYPYNVNILTQQKAYEFLSKEYLKNEQVELILSQREYLIGELNEIGFVNKIYPTDSNFVLVNVNDPKGVYNYLTDKGIIVRDRSKVNLCAGCLRITVGTEQENIKLIEALKTYA